MSRKRNISRITGLAASLALAGAGIFGTAASAQWSRDPVCDQQMADECTTTWQAMGYWSYDHCVGHRQCQDCPPMWGYMCGVGPDYATKPDGDAKPW